jgi:hypothetical protein
MLSPFRILVASIVLAALSSNGLADEAETQKLRERVTLLEAQLAAADASVAAFEKQCEMLKKEISELKGEKEPTESTTADAFAVGVVWIGEAKINGHTGKWALSISERDGNKLSGVVAAVGPAGVKHEITVSGTAPATGNGLVTLESPLVGRAKSFMRGRLTNGEVALAVSLVNRLGEKAFGAATLRPAN